MVEKSRLSIDIYNQYVSRDGSVLWPDDLEEQIYLARAILGRELIAVFDLWIEHANDLIENPEPKKPFLRPNKAYREDAYFRNNLGTLEPKQKKAVRDLIRTTVSGVLFSTLVTLDQGDYGKYDLLLKPFSEKPFISEKTDGISLFTNLPDELHDELNDWIISFSKFLDEILELIQHPKGWWQFQPIEFY